MVMEEIRQAESDLWVSLATFAVPRYGTVELVRLFRKGWLQIDGDRASRPVRGAIAPLSNLARGPVQNVFVDDDDYYIGFAIIKRQKIYPEKFFTVDALVVHMLPGVGIYDIHMTEGHSIALYHSFQRKIWLWLLLELLNKHPDKMASQVKFLMGIPELAPNGTRALIEGKTAPLRRHGAALTHQDANELFTTEYVFRQISGDIQDSIDLQHLSHDDEFANKLKAAADKIFVPLVTARIFSKVKRRFSYDKLEYQVWINDLIPVTLIWDIRDWSWVVGTRDVNGALTVFATGDEVHKLIHKMGLWLEEDQWDAWWDENVFKPASKIYPIDPEPYELLDAGNPYLWPDDKLKTILKGV